MEDFSNKDENKIEIELPEKKLEKVIGGITIHHKDPYFTEYMNNDIIDIGVNEAKTNTTISGF